MKQGDLIEGFKAPEQEDAPPETGALAGLNSAQRYAVSLGKGPILVIAGAGTGKTRTLVHRVAALVEKGVPASSILLLTFTRRAAEEMLTRARELNSECAWVQGGTFHSVANRLIRSHARLVGLTGSFTILDPADCQQMLKGAVEEMGAQGKGRQALSQSQDHGRADQQGAQPGDEPGRHPGGPRAPAFALCRGPGARGPGFRQGQA